MKIKELKKLAAKNDRERRFTPGTVELRAADDEAKSPTIVGYGAMFDKRSVNLGGFTEIIQEGAFDDVLLDPDTRGLFNHDRNWVLGRNGKTMSLRVDAAGLEYTIDPPDTQAGNDVVNLLKRGDIDQSSFGFTVAGDGDFWEEDADTGAITRTITKVSRLFDVSPVTFPAYPDTQVAVRSLEEFLSDDNAAPGEEEPGEERQTDEELIKSQGEQITALTETVRRLSTALEIAERMSQ